MPFFTGTVTKKKLPVIPNCGVCKADRDCRFPKQHWKGNRTPVVFVVPELDQDIDNALIHADFKRLRTLCTRVGITLDSYAKIPVTACPGASTEAWRHCQPLVGAELARLDPVVVIPYGPKATQSVVGRYWQQPAELYDRWYGQKIPCRDLNAWICPVGLPATHKGQGDISTMFAFRWLRDAIRITKRPWEKPIIEPRTLVKSVYNSSEINNLLTHIANTAEYSAFDYETTGLKPEWDTHEIVSVSIAWVESGEVKCIAFPLFSDCVSALKAYLQSPGKKIAANMKFEERWSYKKLGVRVRNWYWDTMQAAHWENPMEGITGLKFQAFARLGIPYFAEDVEQYFDAPSNAERNKIHQVAMPALLTYNGIDAISELLLASVQMVENEIISQHFVPDKYLPTCLNPSS